MTLKELLKQYLNKEITGYQVIRDMTGVFNPDHAVDLLVLCNQIARLESGDLDHDTFKSVWGIE